MAGANKYFTIELTPTIKATAQHLGVYTAGDILWQLTSDNKIQIPSGPARLIGATALVRPKGDAGPTPNNFGIDLVFSKEARTAANGNLVFGKGSPNNDIVGSIQLSAGDHVAAAANNCTSVVSSGSEPGSIVLNRGVELCTVVADRAVGYDTYYVGGIAAGAHFFGVTANRVNETGFSADTQDEITMDDGSGSTSMDCREHFLPGDILHAQDNAVLGTVASVAAREITLTANNVDAIADNDYIYNIHPIRVILSFER
tara:strand:+ start:822 stop:1595 length:774 start_codon:yes stop_codon:yes gene_type:complete